MKKIIFILSITLIPLTILGQIDKKQYSENIEWINNNPSEVSNEVFVSKTVELLNFQMFNYPNLQINVSGMKELDKELKGYKYERYFQILYSFNQLSYKLINEKKYNSINACIYSMEKLIQSYKGIIKNDHSLRIEILDKYAELNEKELKRKMKSII